MKLCASTLRMTRHVRVEEVCPGCTEEIGERGAFVENFGEANEVWTHRSCGSRYLAAPGPEYRPESLNDLGRKLQADSAARVAENRRRWLAAGGRVVAEDFEPVDVAMGKQGKKCPCSQYDADGKCACGYGWAFAPLYGDGEGHSMATMPHDNVSKTGAQTPSPSSPAYPGEGGENAPEVPAGPNAGTGPIVTSRARLRGLTALSEALDYAFQVTAAPEVSDAPPELGGNLGPMVDEEPPPAAAPAPSGPTVASILIAAVHRSFTQAGDVLFAHGHMSQDQRIALSSCVGDALQELTAALTAKCAWAAAAPVDRDTVKSCLEDRAP